MSRLIIDVSSDQHQQIKALAALQGKTIKDFVLEKIFPKGNSSETEAWNELTDFLSSRIEEAENSPVAKQSFEDLTKKIIEKRKQK